MFKEVPEKGTTISSIDDIDKAEEEGLCYTDKNFVRPVRMFNDFLRKNNIKYW